MSFEDLQKKVDRIMRLIEQALANIRQKRRTDPPPKTCKTDNTDENHFEF